MGHKSLITCLYSSWYLSYNKYSLLILKEASYCHFGMSQVGSTSVCLILMLLQRTWKGIVHFTGEIGGKGAFSSFEIKKKNYNELVLSKLLL